MDRLYTRNLLACTHHLLRNHDDRFHTEAPTTYVKQILERWAEEVDDKHIVQPLLAKEVHLGNPRYTAKDLVSAVFVAQLRSIAFARLKLDCDTLPCKEVGAFKDNTKRTLSNFAPNVVVPANHIGATRVRSRHGATPRKMDARAVLEKPVEFGSPPAAGLDCHVNDIF